MTTKGFSLFVLLVCGADASERILIGARLGGALTPRFSPSGGTAPLEGVPGNRRYSSQAHLVVIGPLVEFRMTASLGLEIAGLYRRLRFNSETVSITQIAPGVEGRSGSTSSTSASTWEFPVLLKYYFRDAAVRPYIGGGFSVVRVTNVEQSTDCFSFIGPCRGGGLTSHPVELRYRVAIGTAFAGGVEVPVSRVKVSPEIRYLHYGREQFVDPLSPELLRSKGDCLYLTVGARF